MGMIFIINDDGSKREVLNIEELQELARQGIVLPETKIEAKGRVINAGKIKELTGVFIAARIRRQNEAAADSEKKAESMTVGKSSPAAVDAQIEGAASNGESAAPEAFKPLPEKVEKAKQKKADGFEAFRAKYHLLDIVDKELEDAVNAKHQHAIENIDAALGVLQTIAKCVYFCAFLAGIALLFSFLQSFDVIVEAVATFISSLLCVGLVSVLLRSLRFVKNHFIVNCKDSLKREIYLAELLRKNGE